MKFDLLDRIPYFNEYGTLIPHQKQERVEQMDALEYVPPNSCVLELGARYGTVSCVINSILENPELHVAVEPDLTVYHALDANRVAHGGKFKIFDGVISSTPVYMRHCGYSTHMVRDKSEATFSPKYVSYEKLEKKIGKPFTCIVADMEGAFLSFLQENRSHLRKVNTILYECDGDCDYNAVHTILKQSGFDIVKNGFHCVWKKR